MPRIRRLLFVLPVALLAVSCSSADTLATVNGNDIAQADLVALRPSYDEPSTASAEQMRSDLTLLIFLEAVQSVAKDDFGYEIAESDVEERLANPPPRYFALLAPPDESTDLTDEALSASAIQSLIRDAVVPELAQADFGGFDGLIAEQPGLVTRACARHISLATVEEAEATLARLESGEDFAAVAAEVSLDQVSPGGLIANNAGDCLLWLTRAGLEFATIAATAPLNQPAGPVLSNDLWEIVLVDQRIAPTSAGELAADPMEFFDPDYVETLFTPWLTEAMERSEIELSPTVGRWSETGIGIVPPGE